MKQNVVEKPINIKRYSPNIKMGLTKEQVEERMSQGLHNDDNGVKTKSIKQIILENTFTFFNTINFLLALLVLLTGIFEGITIEHIVKNVLFLGVIFSNVAIGSFQEIRSKKIIDKLSVISAPKAIVLRDGKVEKIAVCEVVLDDLLVLNSGNQICSDSIILDGEIEVNESLITGESDPVFKKKGDELLSGSFVVSGSCTAQAEHIGQENYASKIAADAKYLKKPNSQIVNSLNMIVKFIGFSIIPVGLLLFSKQHFIGDSELYDNVASTVAALIGMIPEGLVLLTSIVFAVSVIRLALHKTLVQELYCIETLARVDVLCLDKTGTITEGTMQVEKLVPLNNYDIEPINMALSALVCNLKDENPTFNAIKEYVKQESDWSCEHIVPFSSSRKYSGASFENKGSYVIGAVEFILKNESNELKEQIESYSNMGLRVLVLCHSENKFNDKALPEEIYPIALIVIGDKIRAEAKDTIKYFAEQGVALKVISGDNPVTVANIAKKVGFESADKYIDATSLKDEDIENAVETYSIFGRVTPEQKLKFVKALKQNGHTVAMTGDGVNDVLALKEADCSVAMASGSDAARTVSNLVLMDSNFASMPLVLKEGRRSINNLQRSATLYLSKTIYSVLMSILFIFVAVSYPFVPIHLTFISSLTIGIPSFFLALEPNKELVKGHFLINVIKMSIPTGLTVFLNIVVLVILQAIFGFSQDEFSSLSVICTAVVSMILLVRICIPFNWLHWVLVVGIGGAMVVAILWLNSIISIVPFNLEMQIIVAVLSVVSVLLVIAIDKILAKILNKSKLFENQTLK